MKIKQEFRSMLDNIFHKELPAQTTRRSFRTAELLNDYQTMFSRYSGKHWEDATIRNCVDVIARNIAKTNAEHIRKVNGKVTKANSNLDYLLSTRPNEYCSAYDFFYRQITDLMIYNNAFVYVQTDNAGNITGLYNLDFSSIEMKEYNNELFCRFLFNMNYITVPYSDIIHLRRCYHDNEIFGDSNSPLNEPAQILLSAKESLREAVVNGNRLRGYLKAPVMITEQQDKDSLLTKFINTFTGKNKTGIGVLGEEADYVSLPNDPKMVDAEQIAECRDDIYRYFGVNAKIINGNFVEEDYVSFYESTVEPILLQMAQEYTYKIFTAREQSFGNEIIFSSNRLEYSSLKNKVSLVHELIPTGILTGNEVRALFGFSELEDLDERLVSLNYVKADDQTKYQTGNDSPAEPQPEPEPQNNDNNEENNENKEEDK